MHFVWDPNKNAANIRKHGIDFSDVPDIFNHPMLTAADLKKDYGEDRWVGIGFLKGTIAVIIFTEDDDIDTIRIISARKATTNEIQSFKEKFKN
jgi:hypothetical protein